MHNVHLFCECAVRRAKSFVTLHSDEANMNGMRKRLFLAVFERCITEKPGFPNVGSLDKSMVVFDFQRI